MVVASECDQDDRGEVERGETFRQQGGGGDLYSWFAYQERVLHACVLHAEHDEPVQAQVGQSCPPNAQLAASEAVLKLMNINPQNQDGALAFTVPWKEDTLLPLIDITDTGKFLEPVLFAPEKYNGKTFTAATAFYTPQQMVDAWTKVTGKKVVFVRRTGGAPMGALSLQMVTSLKESTGLISDYSYYGPTGKKDLEWTLAQMHEEPTSWEDFIKANEPWFEDV